MKPGDLVKLKQFMVKIDYVISRLPTDPQSDMGFWTEPGNPGNKYLLVFSVEHKASPITGRLLWQTVVIADQKPYTFWSKSPPAQYFDVIQQGDSS